MIKSKECTLGEGNNWWNHKGPISVEDNIKGGFWHIIVACCAFYVRPQGIGKFHVRPEAVLHKSISKQCLVCNSG